MTPQLELFRRRTTGEDLPDTFEAHVLARRNDPATSKAAAARAESVVHRSEAEILRVLGEAGCALAAEEIADRCALDQVAVNRRLAGMERKALIARTGETHENRSGRLAAKWMLAP